jgi:hypothetical protein
MQNQDRVIIQQENFRSFNLPHIAIVRRRMDLGLPVFPGFDKEHSAACRQGSFRFSSAVPLLGCRYHWWRVLLANNI